VSEGFAKNKGLPLFSQRIEPERFGIHPADTRGKILRLPIGRDFRLFKHSRYCCADFASHLQTLKIQRTHDIFRFTLKSTSRIALFSRRNPRKTVWRKVYAFNFCAIT